MGDSTKRLADFLASARAVTGKTLRAVQTETGISNAYLSQLETGKIKMPAPQNLHKLAVAYEVPYELLLELAGFPVPNSSDIDAPSKAAARIGSIPITEEEQNALVEYLQFIRSRKRRG
ncbi:helix-turn-helix domain-containing protein [Bradyrhizobium sp. USDA 4520]